MNILGIDTHGPSCSVAVRTNRAMAADICLNKGQTHSRSLMPLVYQALEMARIRPDDLDVLAICIGPGSFTGLRIGISTAKGLAMALNKPAVGVSSLEALALQAGCPNLTICPVIDARRGEIFFARYRFIQNKLDQIFPPTVMPPDQLLDCLDEPCLFIGSGTGICRKLLHQRENTTHHFAPDHSLLLRASSIIATAILSHENDQWADCANGLSPVYLRPPDAKIPPNTRVVGKNSTCA